MPVVIEPQDKDDHFSVNDKTVYRDHNGDMVASEELTDTERQFLRQYLKALTVMETPRPMTATFN